MNTIASGFGYMAIAVVWHLACVVVHRLIFHETLTHCIKNDPAGLRLQKGFVDIVIASICFVLLFTIVLGFLFAFNI